MVLEYTVNDERQEMYTYTDTKTFDLTFSNHPHIPI
jgi:hypothetical protein